MMTFSNVGGDLSALPLRSARRCHNDEIVSLGENQLGVELMGHSDDDHTRYAVSVMSSINGGPWAVRRDEVMTLTLALQSGFLVPHLGLQRVGAYGYAGLRPSILPDFRAERLFRVQAAATVRSRGRVSYASTYFGKFDVTGVYYRFPSDNVSSANATPTTGIFA